MRYWPLLVIIGILCIGCESNESFVDEYEINHHMRPAYGFIPTISLMGRSTSIDVGDWSNLIEGIDGFDFEWGYEYELKVLVTSIENPPADGSSIQYRLLEIISKNKVPKDITFEILLKNGADPQTEFVVPFEGDDHTLLSHISIDCQDRCDELDQLLAGDLSVFGTFEHVDQETIRLLGLRTD